MRLEQLIYVIEIANTGSISTAAEKLHISQPSISQSLFSLEKELNITIFKRSRSGTKPTESGKIIIEKARDILNQIDNLSKTEDSPLTGTLSFTIIPSLGITILPKALGVFKDKYPDVTYNFYEEGSVIAEKKVMDGEVDIALVAHLKGKTYDKKLTFVPLLTSEVKACVGQNSPFAHRKEISLNEIIHSPIVAFNEKYNMHAFILSLLRPYGEPNILFNSENFEVAKKVIAEDLAIGFYTSFPLKTDPYFQSGMIIPLTIKEHKELYFSHGILHKKNSHTSLVVQKFIEELCTQADQYQKAHALPNHY